MKKTCGMILLLLNFLLFLMGCLNLDDFLYSPSKVDEYQFENYSGESELKEINQIYPDSTIDNMDSVLVTFRSGGAILYGAHLIHGDLVNQITIVYCHGNRDHMDNYWPRTKLLYHTGFNVFTFDYKGYGRSEGSISEEALYEDIRSSIAYLEAQGVSKTNMVLYGYSLGSVAAVDIAVSGFMNQGIGLVLESPIGSGEIFVQDATLLPFPGEFFLDLKIDNAEKIKNVTLPLFWIYGKEDERIRWDTHGKALYNNHPGTKYSKPLEKGTHGDLPKVWGFDDYVSAVKLFSSGKAPF